MKYSFPAIFKQDEFDKEIVNVVFPDILGAATFGVGEEEAMAMAKDLLAGLLEQPHIREIKPTPIKDISDIFGKVVLVEVEVNV